MKPLEREANIDVLLKSCSVEIDRDMAHHDVSRRDVARDAAIVCETGMEYRIGAQIECRRRDNSDPTLGKRRSLNPGPTLREDRAIQTHHHASFVEGKFFKSRQFADPPGAKACYEYYVATPFPQHALVDRLGELLA